MRIVPVPLYQHVTLLYLLYSTTGEHITQSTGIYQSTFFCVTFLMIKYLKRLQARKAKYFVALVSEIVL